MRGFFVFLIPLSFAFAHGDRLRISSHSGKAPHSVRITGPSQLVELAQRKFSRWGGCGYIIDWGVKPIAIPVETDCKRGLEYTYSKPGVYTIHARVTRMGPADEVLTDWEGETSLRVSE